LRLVRNEFKSATPLVIVDSHPVSKVLALNTVVDSVTVVVGGGLSGDVTGLAVFSFCHVEDGRSATVGRSDDVAVDFEVFEHDEGGDGTHFDALHGVVHTEGEEFSIASDFIHEFDEELLLGDELDTGESVSGHFDGLVETHITRVGDVDNLQHDGLEAGIEEVGLMESFLELGGTSEDETGDVGSVVGDEVLSSEFGDLSDVVVTALLTNTGETVLGLTTTTVLLWELDRD